MANAQMPEGTQSSEQAPSATPEDLEARIASTRERLAGSVDDLVERAVFFFKQKTAYEM
mgnify:CR=1 FL=1